MNINLPKVLYKYTRYSYALQMLTEGAVRIGTLEDYREDKYGLEIGDKGEGTQTTRMGRFNPIDPTLPETIPPTLKRQIQMGRIKFSPEIEKFTIYGDVNESSQDLYIYSLSTDENVINAFEKAGYDSIIEITNPYGYIEFLTREINRRDSSVITCNFDPVEYFSRVQEIETQTSKHPVFVKEPIHSEQKEFRLAWETSEKIIKPFIFKRTEIKNFIRPYLLPKR